MIAEADVVVDAAHQEDVELPEEDEEAERKAERKAAQRPLSYVYCIHAI